MKNKSVIREWIEAILVAAALAIFVRTFFFQIYKIPTTSMVPTLLPGDKIFVSKLSYGPKLPFSRVRLPGFGKYRRGDVIVFVPPHEKKEPWFRRKQYVKRLIGLPKDKLLIKDGNIYINGQMVVEPTIARNYYYNNDGDYGRPREVVVPQDHFFFLGDNSISSLDSRIWGFAEKRDIVGKAIFIWWPPKRVGMIE